MESEVSCRYCKIFCNEKAICKNGKVFRKCIRIKKLVTYKKTICEHFEIAETIFCERKGRAFPTEKCIKNKTHTKSINNKICVNCPQYIDILNAIEVNSPPPKKILKKRKNSNSKLKRRS